MSEENNICKMTLGRSICNQVAGHDGMHGIDAGGGLIIAPWAGGSSNDRVATELRCLNCGSVMLFSKHADGGTFECSNCEQNHTYNSYGHTYGPSARLWGANLTTEQEIEFVNYSRKEFIFDQDAWLLVGIISQEEHDERIAKCEIDVAKRLAELDKPTLWQRFVRWLRLRTMIWATSFNRHRIGFRANYISAVFYFYSDHWSYEIWLFGKCFTNHKIGDSNLG
jgi:hypothetical protein